MMLAFASAGHATDYDLSLKGSWTGDAGGLAEGVAITNGYAYVADGSAGDRKSTRLNSSHGKLSRMPSSA